MIKEVYVSFETSILLKKNGFNEKCDRVYMHDGKCVCAQNFMEGESFVDNDDIEAVKKYDEPNWIDYIQGEYAYLCPSISLVMKWLREVHNIHIELRVLKPYGTDGHHHSIPKDGVIYHAEILHIDKWDRDLEEFEHVGISAKDTYEQTCEAAIKYCLEINMIKYIERTYDSGPFGDETTNYTVKTSAKTIGEFIKFVTDNFKDEWGEICIRQSNAPYNKICVCAYNRGKMIRKADNYEAYVNATIRSIRANGGWGSMGYDIEIDDFDSLPKQTNENFQEVYFGRIISKK